MIYFWMILWIGLGFSAPPEEEAETLLRNAKTWYYVARLTENSLKAHKRSEALYKKTLVILKDTQSPKGKELQEQAQLGLDQTTPRIDNAHDTFRNVLWPIWWVTESDPTAEWYDDLFMKAVELCWDNIEYQIVRLKEPARIPVIARSFRNPNLPEKSLIDEMTITDRTQLMRDELLIYADTNNSLYGLSDDHGRSAIGENWNDLIGRQDIPTDIIQQLGVELKHQYVMIVDITIADEIPRDTDNTPIVRLDTQAYLVNTNTGTIAHHIYVQGIGKDLRSQNASALWWFIGVFVLTFLTTLVSLKQDDEEHNIHFAGVFGVAFVSYLLGGLLGEFAGDASAEFLQDWGTPSYLREFPNFTIPYIPVLVWPFVHGFVVLIGPLAILAWLSNKLRDLIDTFVENSKSHMRIIAPSAQAGAAMWMFQPLIEGVPDTGLWTAAILTFAAIFCSYVIVRPLSDVIDGKNISRPTLNALGFGGFGLAILLPFGFYHNNAAWIALVVICCGLYSLHYQRKTKEKSSVQQDKEEVNTIKDADGSLENPKWINPFTDLNICTHVEQRQHFNIQAHSKYGSTRAIREYTKELLRGKKQVIRVVVDEKNTARPFSLIKDIFAALGLEKDLEKQANLGATLQGGMGNLGGMLTPFALIGVLVDTVSEREGDENFTRSRIIKEGADLLQKLTQAQNVDALILEDLQYADPSSFEVLIQYIETSAQLPSIIWNSPITSSPEDNISLQDSGLSNFSKAFEEKPLTTYPIPELTLDMAQTFLLNTRITGLSEELTESLVSSAQKSIGGFQRLLLLMVDKDLLLKESTETEDGTIVDSYRTKDNLKERDIWDVLPQDIQKQELLRLAHLDRDTFFIIQAAALSGQTFTVDELVAGSATPEQQVLLRLERIEEIQPPIIEDVSSVDKEFRFLNSMTRIAIIEHLKNSSSGHYRELAKSVHRGVLSTHKQEPFLKTHEVVHHASNLSTHDELLCSALCTLFQEEERKYAWPEMIKTFEQFEARIGASSNTEIISKIHLTVVKAYRFAGGQENRDSMVKLLKEQIQLHQKTLPSWDEQKLFSLFFRLCEGLFEERDPKDLQELIDLCTAQQTFEYPPLIHELFVFYQELSQSMLNRNSPILPQLQQIIARLQIIPDQSTFAYKMIYSTVYQTYANKYWHENQLPRESSREEHQQHKQQLLASWLSEMDHALTLKENINDVQGIAINYGIRGSTYLFTFQDGAKALELFEKDWNVVEENNMTADKAGLLNKLAMSHILLAKSTSNPQQHLDKAMELAMESLHLAEKFKREADFAFTIGTILDLVLQTKNEKMIEFCAQRQGLLVSEEYWESKFPPFLKSNTHKKLIEIQQIQLCSTEPWFTLALKHTAPAEA